MDELDFARLRAEIEAATMLPEFAQVTRRARRVRARGRFATTFAVLAVLAMLTPAGVLAARNRDSGTSIGPVAKPEPPVPEQIGLQEPSPSPSPSHSALPPPQVTIVAADGADIGHVYALVDVCRGGSCSLQLSQVESGTQSTAQSPDRIGLLRAQPTDFLSGYRLTALSDTSLEISAASATGVREYQRIDLGSVSDDARPDTAAVGDRVAVIDASGKLWAMAAKSGQLRSIPHQPPVNQRAVASTAQDAGIWVTGTDPVTGDVAVSVSRDAGMTWTSTRLGVLAGDNTPVLATSHGQVAYLLTRTADRSFALFSTADGGRSWNRLTTALPWPQTDNGTGYGIVVRPDGSLLAWLATSPTLSYIQSTDGGLRFANVSGPGGPVIAVSDGYVSLSTPPKVSSDGSSWTAATLPTLPTTG
jgi:hypothetical protein